MSLLQLPEELLLIIIQQLDIQSLFNLYNTCSHLKKILSMPGVVKECCLSMNTLASVKTMKTDFFLDIAAHLQEINLCGAPDVRKSYLTRALKKTKNLLTLDISYTHLTLLDFIDIFKVCPSIINISLNFMVSRSGLTRLSDEEINECQNAFKNMKNVHFVGSATNLLYSKVALLLLQDAEIDTLKYTVAESDRLHTIYVPQKAESSEMVKFKQFFLCFLDWTTIYAFFGSFFMLPVLSIINIDTIEAIIIIKQNLKQYCIHSTPLFKSYFRETFEVETDRIYITEYRDPIIGNAVIMIWNKEEHTFDDAFFDKLTVKLRPYFPCDCEPYLDETAPPKYDWYFLSPMMPDEEKQEKSYEPPPKKRRARPPVVLDYDELFKLNNRLQLSIIFDEYFTRPATLSPNLNYLSKLTYISITGPVKFTTDFYTILFKSCVNLVTANVESPAISPCVASVCRGIQHAQMLQNLRVVDKKINFNNVYSGLAKCKSLQNICLIQETNAEDCDVGLPIKLLDECPNLYNLFVEGPLTENCKNKKTAKWNSERLKRNKQHIRLMIHARSDVNKIFYSYDPFISVFNLNPIKQI